MKTKSIKQAVVLITTFEGLFAIVFAILFVMAIFSIFSGAWWHIFTAIVSFILLYMLIKDIKRIKHEDSQYEPDDEYFKRNMIL